MLASSGLSGADAPSLGECASCWGAHIHGGATCVPQFVPGKHNFKNKFCHNCKQSIMVPADRICTLTTELAARFLNKRSEGFWNHAPASMGGGQYRILNNTASCLGPWLALFREQPPPFDWSLTYSSSRTKIELGSNQTTSPSRSLHALTFLMLAPAHMQASFHRLHHSHRLWNQRPHTPELAANKSHELTFRHTLLFSSCLQAGPARDMDQ